MLFRQSGTPHRKTDSMFPPSKRITAAIPRLKQQVQSAPLNRLSSTPKKSSVPASFFVVLSLLIHFVNEKYWKLTIKLSEKITCAQY